MDSDIFIFGFCKFYLLFSLSDMIPPTFSVWFFLKFLIYLSSMEYNVFILQVAFDDPKCTSDQTIGLFWEMNLCCKFDDIEHREFNDGIDIVFRDEVYVLIADSWWVILDH